MKRFYEFRGIRNGYTKLTGVINNLIYNNIHVGIGLTILRENLSEIEKLVKLSDDLGADFFRAVPVLPIGNAKEYNTDTDFYSHCIKLLLAMKKKYEKLSYVSYNENNIVDDPDIITKKLLVKCSGGREKFIISNYGNINFCPLVSYDLNSPTYFNDSFENLAFNVLKHKSGCLENIAGLINECSDCEYFNLCNYGCMAEIYARINGSVKQIFCMKKIVREILEDDNPAKDNLHMINYVTTHIDILRKNNLFTECYRCLPFWTVYFTS